MFINPIQRSIWKKFKLEECKLTATHLHHACNLIKNDISREAEQKLYRCMIDPLLYLIGSIHDILFIIYLCARLQLYPRESHLNVVKRIFRYLTETTKLDLLYMKFQNYKLVGFCDANYVGDKLKESPPVKIVTPHFIF